MFSPDTKKRKIDDNLEVDCEFRDKLLSNLKLQYDSQLFCDVTLIADADGKIITAHRSILSAASEYFKNLLLNATKRKKHHILKRIYGHNLKAVTDFCYTGIININESNVFEILKTATQLQFSDVEKKCCLFLSKNLSVLNCLTIWTSDELKPLLYSKDLLEAAKRFAKEHFVEIVKSDIFNQLDFEHFLDLLKTDELIIYSEEEVFNTMMQWVNYDGYARKRYVRKLLPAIQFAYLKSSFINETVCPFYDKYDSSIVKEILKWKAVPRSQPSFLNEPRPSTASRYIAIENQSTSSDGCLGAEVYYPQLGKWSVLKEFALDRYNFRSVMIEGELYIMGGYCPKQQDSMKDMQKFNFVTNEWTNLKEMSALRRYFAVAVLNNKIYVAGGIDSRSVERYDKKTNSWKCVASMNEKRRDFWLVPLNNDLYAIGGREELGQRDRFRYIKTVEKYDVKANTWTYVASLNQRKLPNAVFAQNGRLYAIVGIRDKTEYYDPVIDKWTEIDDLLIPRYWFACTTDSGGDSIIIAGGKCSTDEVLKSSVIKINMKTFKQKELPPMNKARQHFYLFKIPRYNHNDSD